MSAYTPAPERPQVHAPEPATAPPPDYDDDAGETVVTSLSSLVGEPIWVAWRTEAREDGKPTRACHQLSQTTLATSWMAARKFRAVFS
jgi:hypothetical protein